MLTGPQQPGVPACHSALSLLTDEIWGIIWQRGPVSSLNKGFQQTGWAGKTRD